LGRGKESFAGGGDTVKTTCGFVSGNDMGKRGGKEAMK
jgi:hypothetical protein